MSNVEKIIIWGLPIAMPRPRSTALMRNGKPVIGKGGRPIIIAHTASKPGGGPHPAVQFKSDIRSAVQARVVDYSEKGSVRVSWLAFFHRPDYLCRKKHPDAPIRHTKKPDRDNIDKSILDALTGVICKDDSQVCSTHFMEKYYCAKPDTGYGELERPHVQIWIEWINEEGDNVDFSDYNYHPPQRPPQEP